MVFNLTNETVNLLSERHIRILYIEAKMKKGSNFSNTKKKQTHTQRESNGFDATSANILQIFEMFSMCILKNFVIMARHFHIDEK